MESLIKYLPQNLSGWELVAIVFFIVLGIYSIAKVTGNISKKSNSYKNISQSGNFNNQRIGDNNNNGKK